MKSKFKSAPALLSVLSLLLLMSAANVDDPTGLEQSSRGERLDGRDDSYRTLKSAKIAPAGDSPKVFRSDPSNKSLDDSFDEKTRPFEILKCNSKDYFLGQLKFSNDSEWRINQTGLQDVLHNDPQALIECTEPGDRVVFELTGAQKFNRTLAVHHKLELISRAPETDKNNDELTNVATFSCPNSDAFLRTNSSDFTASGFIVQNCTQKDGNSTVVIYSGSDVTFIGFRFDKNQARAIYTEPDVNLTLENSHFEKNGADVDYGGAIYASSGLQIQIHDSLYEGNIARRFGGAICFGQNCSVTIVGSTFSGNRASKGGAIFVQKSNSVSIDTSMFYKNNASFGAVLYIHENNALTMRASNFTNNQAKETAAVVALMDNNNATIEEAKFSNNIAPGASVMLLSIHNNVTIISSSLTGNRAMSYGSAIYLYEHCILYIENSNLSDNKGAWYGGALGANVFSSITIVNSSFRGNAARWGGALYIESNANVSISNSHFLKNNASRGGAVRVGMDSEMTIRHSTFEQNNATNGGCLYMDSSEIEVQSSNFTENKAQKLGGCFLADSSSIMVNESTLSQNKANDGGGIHASTRTFLNMQETMLNSNYANGSAGGLALMYDSRLLCFSCKFISNTAKQGGGLYIESHTKQLVVARLQNSTFESNSASTYGGGMVVETLETKRVNCDEPLAPCSKVLLFGTDFKNNRANISGSAILATTPSNVLVNCSNEMEHASSIFISREILLILQQNTMKRIDPKGTCPSWQGNSLPFDAPGDVIGTFGHRLALKIVSSDGLQIIGNHTSGFMLQNVRSAEQFPRINVTTIDAFGNAPAPVMFSDDALQLSSSIQLLKNKITVSFENMSCVISSISASAPKDNYTIKIIPKEEDVLEQTILNISISDCGVNEELTKDTKVCQDCRNGSYNFDAYKQEHCETCPKHADCDGIFLLVEEGYWQRSPCHDRVKKCIVKKACNYPNRTENITTFVQNYNDCSFNKTNLEEYGKIQCHKGYKGPLCGSCKKSYGLSTKSECSKCGHAIVIVLRFLGALVYLLAGTIITMKGILPSSSSQQKCEDVETPLLEHGSSTTMDIGSSSQARADTENGNQDSRQPLINGDENSQNSRSNGNDEIEVTKQKLISLNYFQVTSHAASMDVEWTKKILDMLEGLNILGAATTEPISYSFDCLFSSSNASKAIWGVLLSLFVPTIVISLLSLYWGYKSLARHSGDWVYFLRRLTLSVITVTYAAYFDLTQVAMRTFSCVVVHNNSDPFSTATNTYWVGDTSIECYKSTHIVLVCISLVVVALVTIGFPTSTTFTLNYHKSEVRDTSTWTHDTLGFLGGPFKQRFIYWECVIMIKKAILSIIIVFSYSLEAQAQGLLILLVLVFFLYTHFLCYPYDEEYRTLNYYESGSLLVSCVTFTLIQFFNVERFSEVARSIISLSIIAINVAFVCLMVYKIVTDLLHLLRALLKSQNVHIPQNMNVVSLIRIYSKNQRSR